MREFLLITTIIFYSFTSFGQDASNIQLLGQAATDDIRYSGSWAYITPDSIEYALIGARSGLAVFPIDDPTNMELVGWVPGPVTNWREITVIEDHAFVVTDVSGSGHSMQVVDLSFLPDSVHLVTEYTTTFTRGHIIQKDIFTDEPFVYINGTSATEGVHILDVSDPTNPLEIGLYAPGYYIHDCHVRGDLLFACAFNNSQVDIVDISDKTNPTQIGLITYNGNNTHSCFTSDDGNYLFLADEFDGLPARIFDISNIDNPIEVATYSANLQSLVHNPYIKGDFTYISHNTEGLRVVDITDPELPVEVGFYDTWEGPSGGFSGLWSACPFFPSGKIIGANRHDGLYVWSFNQTKAARFYGRVFDINTDESLPSAIVELTTLDTLLPIGFDGQFKYGLLAGNYNLTANHPDYLTATLDFQLEEGDSLFLEIGLESVTATEELLTKTTISCAPNPMKDFSILEWEDNKAMYLQIHQLNGIRLREVNIQDRQSFQVTNEDLEPGVYLISLLSAKKELIDQIKLVVVP